MSEEKIHSGETFPDGKLTRVQCCSALKKDTLKQILEKHPFQGLIWEYTLRETIPVPELHFNQGRGDGA